MVSPRPPNPKASRPKNRIKSRWGTLDADQTVAAASAAVRIRKSCGERNPVPYVGSASDASAAASTRSMLNTAELVSAVCGAWRAVGYRGEKPREESPALRCVASGGEESGLLVAGGPSESREQFDLRGADGDSASEAGSNCEQLRAMKKCLLFGPSGPFLVKSAGSRWLYGSALRSCCGLDSLTSPARYGDGRAGAGECSTSWNSSVCSPAPNSQGLSSTISTSSGRDSAIVCRDSTTNDGGSLVEKRGDSSSSSLHSRDSGVNATSQTPSLSLEAQIEPVVSTGSVLSHGSNCVTVESSRDSSVSNVCQSRPSNASPPPCFASEEMQLSAVPAQNKASIAFAKQKHALAGALAGTFVSLCLHPVDTVKTVIQAQSMHKLSFCDTFRSIISQRGVMGLYRGIASNIASSAPTSAVYTFTYETVKAALLPHLPKECVSLAHCTAGGCASVATSFIFTPSERIKQQMQIRSQYQNCWTTLVGIVEKGGFPSLYAGWSAVLCRNIPHSIIKFYTYEKLKQLFPSSLESNVRLNTLRTLVCGGLAGSTAAFFTTPFDVVKTRLQTQVPGSIAQYSGVFHVLKEIAKGEGLSGLYRGLNARLVMYISQGAIFFASYELFKSVFSLEVLLLPQTQDSIDVRHNRERETFV